jgi:hypothetical protein
MQNTALSMHFKRQRTGVDDKVHTLISRQPTGETGLSNFKSGFQGSGKGQIGIFQLKAFAFLQAFCLFEGYLRLGAAR